MRRRRSRLFTAVCVFLLLFAQFGALTHASWHAAHGDAYVEHTSEPADEHAPGQALLCAFDLAFGQVLGGVHTGVTLTFALAPGAVSRLDIPAARLHAEALSPKSRGPPRFL
jgi:hypothetical protein